MQLLLSPPLPSTRIQLKMPRITLYDYAYASEMLSLDVLTHKTIFSQPSLLTENPVVPQNMKMWRGKGRKKNTNHQLPCACALSQVRCCSVCCPCKTPLEYRRRRRITFRRAWSLLSIPFYMQDVYPHDVTFEVFPPVYCVRIVLHDKSTTSLPSAQHN